ncbi:MAG: pyridoxine 5'-phosphate synthase [Herminiimonas sp.]|nr:pyridoxine 5'-phosphate synthase [Herminiimonas sp.]
MTKLSVNINKIALLRNARGRDYPNVYDFAARCLDLGAHGITLHPREDQRHARYDDVADLAALCREHACELNVEGYPSPQLLDVVMQVRPAQCTLVPDMPGQLTSDHGWDIRAHEVLLKSVIPKLSAQGIRVSLFMDHDYAFPEAALEVGADRIELYTEPYAIHYGTAAGEAMFEQFRQAAARAQKLGLGVNAGHDLSLDNLAQFVQIPGILEVSIGHALIVECIDAGLPVVIGRYLNIVDHH